MPNNPPFVLADTTATSHEIRITQIPDLYLNQLFERQNHPFPCSVWVTSGQIRHLDETLIPYPIQMQTPQ